MKLILLCLSIFYLFPSYAQEENAVVVPVKNSKFSFGWTYTPEASYRFLSLGSEEAYGEADYFTSGYIELRNERERTKFGQSANVFLGYKLFKKGTLEAGIGYTNFGVATKPKHVHYMATDNDPSVIYDVYRLNNFHVLSLPVNLHVNFGQGRVKGFYSFGLSPGYLFESRQTEHREYENGKKTKKTTVTSDDGDFSKFILGAQISCGIDYHVSSKAILRIAPVFRVTTNSMYTDKEIRGNYFNAGITIGSVYRF